MTTLTDRPNTALLVVDVQNGVMKASVDAGSVIANIVTLVEKARAAGTEVVWVQHTSDELPRGSETWEYVPELVRHETEPLVHKTYGDSFEDTDLEEVLAARGIGALVVAGAQTDACIRSTLHGALARGDRKSTRLNSSHRCISYAVFCLKKKKKNYAKQHIIHCNAPSHRAQLS